MRQSASNPRACQKVTCGNPNNAGASQFHRSITTSPPIQAKTAIPTIPNGAIQISLFSVFRLLLMLYSSLIRKLVVDALQSFAQMQHRIPFAREQRVDVYSAFGGQIFEAAALQFVCDEYETLLVGQFVQCKLQLVQKHLADVKRFRSGIG